MSAILDKFKGFLGVTDYDEYDNDDVEYPFSREEDKEPETRRRTYAKSYDNTEEYDDSESTKSGGLFSSRLSSFSFGNSSKVETKVAPRRTEPKRDFRSNTKEEARKMVNVGNAGMRVVLCKPTEFDNCQTICSHLRAQMTIVLNLEYVANAADRKRIFDFVSGCCYALDGNIQKVADLIYVVAPCSVDVYAECGEEDKADTYDYDSIY